MKKITMAILMPFFLANFTFIFLGCSGATLFNMFGKKLTPQEEAMKQYEEQQEEYYRKVREEREQERQKREEEKRLEKARQDALANMQYTPKNKKELIALLKKSNIPLEKIDVSQIKDLSYLFAENYGREDFSGLEKWKVNAKKMQFMFTSPYISTLPSWYVEFIKKNPTYKPESREELERILSDDRVNYAEIDVSKIKDFSKLFYYSSKRLVGIEHWDMSNAENLERMFEFFSGSIKGDISKWNTSKVKNMKNLFMGSKVDKYPEWYIAFTKAHPTYQPKNKKELIEILKKYENEFIATRGRYGFSVSYEALPLIEIDVSAIKDLSYVFCSSKRLADKQCQNRITNFKGIEYWDVSNVENMERIFMGSKININLSNWNVSKVKNFYEAFAESAFMQDISNWQVQKGANVQRMFFDSALEREGSLPSWAE